jgi:hypothetical protein
LITSYAAQVTDEYRHEIKQKLNSTPWPLDQVLYSRTNGPSYHGSARPMAREPTTCLSSTFTYRSRWK